MRRNYTQGQPTVFGMQMPRRLCWRHRIDAQRAYEAWQRAAELCARPEPEWLYTDENVPMRNPHFIPRGGDGGPGHTNGGDAGKEQP